MKVAVIGKGGVGKTVVSGILSRSLARQGWNVVALDCDSNPNLGISLGIGTDATERLAAIRQALDENEGAHASTVEELLQRFGIRGPDNVQLAVVTQIDHPDPGWPWCGISPEQLLGQIESHEEGRSVVVADMEAGLGTLTRMEEGSLDRILLVANPSLKSIEVVQRARQVIADRNIGASIVVVANRLRSEADLERITSALDGIEHIAISEDPAITDADIRALSPVDEAPASQAVMAIEGLARSWTTSN